MKKSVKWALGIVSALLMVGAITAKNETPKTAEDEKTFSIDPRGVAFAELILGQDLLIYLDGGDAEFWPSRLPVGERISARQYRAIYHANEIAADERFKGKPVVITGTIGSINKDAFGTAYLDLAAGDIFSTVHAELDDEMKTEAASFIKGDKVMLFCTGGTMIIGFPTATKCLSKNVLFGIYGPKAADDVRAVLTGTSRASSKDRQMIVVLYLAGTLLPPGSPCEKAKAGETEACEKAITESGLFKKTELKTRYSELQTKLDLPPLPSQADSK